MGRHGKRVAMRPRYCLRKLPDASPSIWVTDKCPRPCSRTSAVCFLPLLKLCAQLRRLADDNGTFPISSISTKRSVEPFKNRFTSLFLDVFFFFLKNQLHFEKEFLYASLIFVPKIYERNWSEFLIAWTGGLKKKLRLQVRTDVVTRPTVETDFSA